MLPPHIGDRVKLLDNGYLDMAGDDVDFSVGVLGTVVHISSESEPTLYGIQLDGQRPPAYGPHEGWALYESEFEVVAVS